MAPHSTRFRAPEPTRGSTGFVSSVRSSPQDPIHSRAAGPLLPDFSHAVGRVHNLLNFCTFHIDYALPPQIVRDPCATPPLPPG